ncbi:peptide ABC transporter ATP-binding protein [Campylobacter showae]|uniref:peptide ABC transporter ATP-binding protein n=1 Tax=Campylobacter showae TaxID=204 RepID=UPI000F09229B|nr:peptide ABC transporter ATP-binding protein [Campylobacter showae]
MKQILIFLVFLAGLYAANIYVNGEKVGGSDQNSTYNSESKNEILKQEGKKHLCKKGYKQYC